MTKIIYPKLHYPFKKCFWCGSPLFTWDKHKINMSKTRRKAKIVYACGGCRDIYLENKLKNKQKKK